MSSQTILKKTKLLAENNANFSYLFNYKFKCLRPYGKNPTALSSLYSDIAELSSAQFFSTMWKSLREMDEDLAAKNILNLFISTLFITVCLDKLLDKLTTNNLTICGYHTEQHEMGMGGFGLTEVSCWLYKDNANVNVLLGYKKLYDDFLQGQLDEINVIAMHDAIIKMTLSGRNISTFDNFKKGNSQRLTLGNITTQLVPVLKDGLTKFNDINNI